MNIDTVDPGHAASAGRDYYDGAEIVDHLLASLRDAGLDPDALDIDDLAPLDEFHALGRAATLALAELAEIQPGTTVLDVGAGIGGPARVLAARFGAEVTALDATPRFCKAAEVLTRGAGLEQQVRVVCGDALELPFPEHSFDLAWTQAVSQNIPDKDRFFGELERVVRPGGKVAVFEVLAGDGGSLEFPVPWADHEGQSWLVTAETLRQLLNSRLLTLTQWNEGQDALDAIARAAQRLSPPPSKPQLGLQILMPDFEARMAGLATNVAQRKLALVQAAARRA